MDYTPQQPQQKPQEPTYELKKDVTGKAPPVRGPQTITVVKYNEKNEKETVQVKVPFAPKANCKKCHGRGYIGFVAKTGQIIPCVKCFPPPR